MTMPFHFGAALSFSAHLGKSWMNGRYYILAPKSRSTNSALAAFAPSSDSKASLLV
jgi:hypothetical protein